MPLYHAPINVRTDTVQLLADLLAQEENNLTLASKIESLLPRTRDVVHFYPPSQQGYREELSYNSKLRLSVSQTIVKFAEEENIRRADSGRKALDVFVGVAGANAEKGRVSPQVDYVKTMLSTKIIVVTQRDAWEDHWRLFEAMVTGPLIIVDTILALPDGLVNGESFVMFHTLTQLQDQIRYYLDPANEAERIAIATKGRFVAMNRHRSWHRMEEIAFGEVKSTCDVSRLPDCPYTVHAT